MTVKWQYGLNIAKLYDGSVGKKYDGKLDGYNTEETMYRLYVLENIRRGQQYATEGKTQSAEELLKGAVTNKPSEAGYFIKDG